MTGMATRTGQGPLTESELDDWYADGVPGTGPWVRASFITSLDGRATGPTGVSGDLNAGSEGDHAAFQAIRRWGDVVVVAAGTARAEGYEPLVGTPMIVVTRTGDVPESLQQPPDDGHGEVIVLAGSNVLPEQVLAHAARRGWRHVVLEGGPTLLRQWLEHDAVDELCLTVRPVLLGGDGPLVVPPGTEVPGPPGPRGRATHLVEWGGDLLVRTRLHG